VPRKKATPPEEIAPREEPTPTEALALGAPRNPLARSAEERRPNIRLRRTREGTAARALHGEHYNALRRVRLAGEGVTYDLPQLADGTPDTERQRAGWHDPYAHRILESPHGRIHYQPVRDKGARR
jgi:hypothetical protein